MSYRRVLTDAWIETRLSLIGGQSIVSRVLTDAWIETRFNELLPRRKRVASSRTRGLKLAHVKSCRSVFESRPHGRVD